MVRLLDFPRFWKSLTCIPDTASSLPEQKPAGWQKICSLLLGSSGDSPETQSWK